MLGMTFPLTLMGQQESHWANGELRKQVINISHEVPFAIEAYDFVERYLTQLSKMDKAEQKSRMDRDGVMILKGNIDRITLINEKTSLGFYEKDNHYVVSFFNDQFPLIDIKFPASCQLMLGMNLRQLEQQFLKEIKNDTLSCVLPHKVDKKMLKHIKGNFYVSKGSHYFLEEINDYMFFEEKKGDLIPVFSSLHPDESVRNLFCSDQLQKDKKICLTIRKYGLSKEILTIPLSSFINYLEQNGCKIYVGIEKLSTKSISAIVFGVNNVLKYNHVMNVEIPYTFLNKKSFILQGDINLFIPTHNIASIFGEVNTLKKSYNRKYE